MRLVDYGLNNYKIGKALGMNEKTVQKLRKQLKNEGG